MVQVTFSRGPVVDQRRGRGRSQRYVDIANGTFIEPVKRGKTSLYPDHEVDAINRAELAGATKDELRELVKRLHAARKQGQVAA